MTHAHSRTPDISLLERWAEALTTPQFQSHRITLEALIGTLAPAAKRSFQRPMQDHTAGRISRHRRSSPRHNLLTLLNTEIDDRFVNDTLCLAFHEQWTH